MTTPTPKSATQPVPADPASKPFARYLRVPWRPVLAVAAAVLALCWPPQALATEWSPVTGGASINIDPARSLSGPHLTVVNGRLYAGWREYNSASVSQVRVAVYNGDDNAPVWALVDRKVNGVPRPLDQGLNANPAVSVTSNLWFAAVGNILYASWVENGCVRVSSYDVTKERDGWTFVDFGASGVNYRASKGADAQRLVVFYGELYAFWRELGPSVKGTSPYQVRARKYNGSSWTWVDGGKATGMNVDSTKGIWSLFPVVFNGQDLYVGFGEVVTEGSRKTRPKAALRVKRYQGGNSWALVDGGGVAFGYRVGDVKGGADASGIYFAWQDEIRTSDNYIDRWPLRVHTYNAAAPAPQWAQLDDPQTPGTIQFDPLRSVTPGRLTRFGDQIIFTWSEWAMYETPGEPLLRARAWDGVNLTWMDGGVAAFSTLHEEPGSEGSGHVLTPFNGKLYKFTAERIDGASRGFISVLQQ